MLVAAALDAPDVSARHVATLAEALVLVEEFEPDAIVIEPMTGCRLDGNVVTALCAAASARRGTRPRVILHTRHPEPAMEDGVAAHFLKPTPIPTLRAALLSS